MGRRRVAPGGGGAGRAQDAHAAADKAHPREAGSGESSSNHGRTSPAGPQSPPAASPSGASDLLTPFASRTLLRYLSDTDAAAAAADKLVCLLDMDLAAFADPATANEQVSEFFHAVQAADGDIFRLLGDVIVAVWSPPAGDDLVLASHIKRMTNCVTAIFSALVAPPSMYRSSDGVMVLPRAAFAFGTVQTAQMGTTKGDLPASCYLFGPGVAAAWSALEVARRLDTEALVVAEDFWQSIDHSSIPMESSPAPDAEGFLVLCAPVGATPRTAAVNVVGANHSGVPALESVSSFPSMSLLSRLPKIAKAPKAARRSLPRYLPQALIDHSVRAGETLEHPHAALLMVRIPGVTPEALSAGGIGAILETLVVRGQGHLHAASVDAQGAVVLVIGFGFPPMDEAKASLRAVSAGLELLDELDRKHAGATAAVASGLLCTAVMGTMARRELAIVGAPWNLCIRLLQTAGDEHRILIDEATLEACGSRFQVKNCAALRVRGLGEQVPTFQPLQGVRNVNELQTSAADNAANDVTGHSALRATLNSQILKTKNTGGAHLTLLMGEPGIGKSKLAEFVVRCSSREGFNVITAAAEIQEARSPYFVFRGILTSALLLQHPETDESVSLPSIREAAEAIIKKLRGDAWRNYLALLNLVLGTEFDETPWSRELTNQARAAEAEKLIINVLIEVVRRQRTLIVVEDIHWSDSSSLRLFNTVSKAMSEDRSLACLMVCTCRDTSSEVEVSPALRATANSRASTGSAVPANSGNTTVSGMIRRASLQPPPPQFGAQKKMELQPGGGSSGSAPAESGSDIAAPPSPLARAGPGAVSPPKKMRKSKSGPQNKDMSETAADTWYMSSMPIASINVNVAQGAAAATSTDRMRTGPPPENVEFGDVYDPYSHTAVLSVHSVYGTLQPEFAAMAARDATVKITVPPLERRDVVPLLAIHDATLPGLDESVIDFLFDNTGGNPLHLLHLFWHSQERQALLVDDETHLMVLSSKANLQATLLNTAASQGGTSSQMRDSGVLPSDSGGTFMTPTMIIRRVISMRLQRLHPNLLGVLKAASVLPRIFSLSLLSKAYTSAFQRPLDTSVAQGHLNQLVEQHLVVKVGAKSDFRFQHSLVRSAVYRLITAVRRRVFHEAVAKLLEDQYRNEIFQVLPLLAHHWHLADVPDRALYFLDRALELSASAAAPNETLFFGRRCLHLVRKNPGAVQLTVAKRVRWYRYLAEAEYDLGYDTSVHYAKRAAALAGLAVPETRFAVIRELARQVFRFWRQRQGKFSNSGFRKMLRSVHEALSGPQRDVFEYQRVLDLCALFTLATRSHYQALQPTKFALMGLILVNTAESLGDFHESLLAAYTHVTPIFMLMSQNSRLFYWDKLSAEYTERINLLLSVAELQNTTTSTQLDQVIALTHISQAQLGDADKRLEALVATSERVCDKRMLLESESALASVMYLQGNLAGSVQIGQAIYHRSQTDMIIDNLSSSVAFRILLQGYLETGEFEEAKEVANHARPWQLLSELGQMPAILGTRLTICCLCVSAFYKSNSKANAAQLATATLKVFFRIKMVYAIMYPGIAALCETLISLYEDRKRDGSDSATVSAARSAATKAVKAFRHLVKTIIVAEPRCIILEALLLAAEGKRDRAQKRLRAAIEAARSLQITVEERKALKILEGMRAG